MSEDVLGKPFIGPAGKLLDAIIEDALEGQYSYALTNLVACIPMGDDHKKTAEPPKESIMECAPRLLELIGMAKPKVFVAVGVLAGKWLPKVYRGLPIDRTIQITHPAAILRMDNQAQKELAVQRATVMLADAVENL
jgi:DNA polymerase